MGQHHVKGAVALAAAGLMVVAGCGSSSKKSTTGATSGTTAAASKYAPIPAGPIVFGVSAPLSGPTAAFGISTQKSFDGVTLKNFNARHPDGIDGHPVKVEILDDASDVTKAVNVANQFVTEKVAAVVTVSYNPPAQAQQDAIFAKAKIPVFSSQGGTDFTDAQKWPYMFGISASTPQEGKAAADWITKHSEIKKIAVLSDNAPTSMDLMNSILNPLKTSAPSVQVVKTATITPGAVDVSTAVAQLKDTNPDLLLVMVGFGFGPIWQGIQGANWSPKIMVGAGAWYDGFSAMGPLADNALAPYVECVKEGHPPFPQALTTAMDGYISIFGTSTVNYITYVVTDDGPLELLKLAIEKNHSVDPDAIKSALENAGPQTLLGAVTFNYTPTNHFGLTGDLGANVCKMSPYSDGQYRVPFVAP